MKNALVTGAGSAEGIGFGQVGRGHPPGRGAGADGPLDRFGVSTGAEHLQLGWDDALVSIDREPLDIAAATRRPSPGGPPEEAVLPSAADPFFAIERIRPAAGAAEVGASFAVLVVLDGAGVLRTEHGGELALNRGQTCLVPYAAGPSRFEGDLHVLRCLPPHPNH